MATIFDVNPNELIDAASQELKNIPEVTPPEWGGYVKTGVSRERPPLNKDWWYIRAAAVLRTVYMQGPIGVSKLRTKYGSIMNRGARPEVFRKGSGNILRKILQQLAKAGLVKKAEKGVHKGKVITPKGESFLSKVSINVLKKGRKEERARPKEVKKEKAPEPAKKEAKAEEKPAEPKKEKPASAKKEPPKGDVNKKIEKHVEKIVEAAKKHAKGEPLEEKGPSAEELVKEAQKEEQKKAEKVPTAEELAKKKASEPSKQKKNGS